MYDGDVSIRYRSRRCGAIAAKIEERPEPRWIGFNFARSLSGVVDEGLITDLKRQYPSTKFQFQDPVRLVETPAHGSSHRVGP